LLFFCVKEGREGGERLDAEVMMRDVGSGRVEG
jgi:hypothetical protein